jgi:pSer/pThr/pTyr-binding forkhead associated (FHA) protein
MSNQASQAEPSASQPNAIARIIWNEGDVEKEKLVTGSGLTIGRSSQNGLMINDLAASRFHCKFLPEGQELTVIDLDSTNGTFINGKRLTGNQVVKNGDQVRIGEIVFKIEIFLSTPQKETQAAEPEELSLESTYVVLAEADFPWLVVSSGVGKGTIIPLTKKQMQIGRASRNKQWDIDLVDRAVSRPHAELVQDRDQWVLKDLGSANGTALNGKRVTDPQVLQDGDVIGFGETMLIFRSGKGT